MVCPQSLYPSILLQFVLNVRGTRTSYCLVLLGRLLVSHGKKVCCHSIEEKAERRSLYLTIV